MTDTLQQIVEQQHTLTVEQYAADKPSFMLLTQLSVIQVEGEEAQGFLQNLLTNDVNDLAVNQSQLSAFCNAKGRIFAQFLLIRRSDYYQLVLPDAMCTTLHQRLSMYVLRSKVTISNMSESMSCFGFTHPDNDSAQTLNLDDELYQQNEQLPGDDNRCLAIVNNDDATALLNTINQQTWQLSSEKVWDLLDIEAGLPSITVNTKEKFTPQQINFDLIGGVSFKKGCYPGQEVVARMHYLGKASRRLFPAMATSSALPELGDEVLTASGDVAGHIVSAQQEDGQTIKLLLALKLSELDSELVFNKTTALTLLSKDVSE